MVPSIYTIAPSAGLASGRERVVLTGYFFKLPTVPSPLVPSVAQAPTVSVRFNGVEADTVAVLSDQEILVVTPPYYGDPGTMPAAVDISVRNLDAAGLPVPGEEFTLVGGFEYRRPDVTQVTALQWVSRQVMRDLRRNTIDNVALSSSPDWSSDPAISLAAIAELPAILIEGPTVQENTFYRNSVVQDEDYGDGVALNAGPFTADLEWVIILLARRKTEALNICDTVLRYLRRRPEFSFPFGPLDSSLVKCRRYFSDWKPADRFAEQVYSFEATLKLEALVFDDVDGMPVDAGITHEVDSDPEMNCNPMEVDDG
jgi:hypothetical protein